MWKVKKSKIHNAGVFATTHIKKGEKIIQYFGKKITRSESDRRSEKRIKRYLNSQKLDQFIFLNLIKDTI